MEKGSVLYSSEEEFLIERTATDETIKQVCDYVTKVFDTTDNSVVQLENCKKLSIYLIKNEITIGYVEADKLLEQSEEIMKMLSRLSIAGTLPKVYNFQNLLSLLEIYSQKTNTQLENDFDIEFYNERSDNDLDLFKLYLSEIGQYPILTREEERELAIKSKNGDLEARNKLVSHNLRLVIPVAKRFVSQEISLPELVLAGNEGLMTAVRKFNPDLGYKFSTYATWWIRQALQRGVLESGRSVRIPAHIYEYVLKFKKEMAIYYSATGTYPSDEYLAEKFNITVAKVLQVRQNMEPIVSLSTPIGSEDKDTTLGDMIVDERNPFDDSLESMDSEQLATELINSNKLTEKEREILKLRFGFYDDTKTLEEIGRQYNLSRERIRQIERLALKKLLRAYQSKKFRAYTRRYSR